PFSRRARAVNEEKRSRVTGRLIPPILPIPLISMKITRYLALLPLAALSVFSALAENHTPPPGYTALFDGKTLDGWYGWSTEDPNDLWKLSPEEQAEYKRKSIEGGLTDKKGNPSNDYINAHWRVENG